MVMITKTCVQGLNFFCRSSGGTDVCIDYQ